MNTLLLSMLLTAQPAVQPSPGVEYIPAPPPPTFLSPPPKPMTLGEFGASFVPLPGIHDVTIVHPVTGKPINVVFRLPDMPIKKVYNSRTRMTFDYGKSEVTLIFRLIGGKMDVRYD